jgi:hypothetical protein
MRATTDVETGLGLEMPTGVSFDTARLDAMKIRVRGGEHRRHRLSSAPDVLTECEAESLPWIKRVAQLVERYGVYG